jgi:hypothetical protein
LLRAHDSDLREQSREQIKQTARGLPEKQHWMNIYSSLFPSSPSPSPREKKTSKITGLKNSQLIWRTDYDRESDTTLPKQHSSSGINDSIQSFINYLHSVLPSRLREEFARQKCVRDQVPSADMLLDDAVRTCLNQTGAEWLQVHDLQSADLQGLTSQRWYCDLSTNWASDPNNEPSCLNQSLSYSDLESQYLAPWNQNGMSVQPSTLPMQFEHDGVGPFPVGLGGPYYSSREIRDCSVL